MYELEASEKRSQGGTANDSARSSRSEAIEDDNNDDDGACSDVFRPPVKDIAYNDNSLAFGTPLSQTPAG